MKSRCYKLAHGLAMLGVIALSGCKPVVKPRVADTASPTTATTVVVAEAKPLAIVDEPLGARYSLGMTLWHMGHNAETIARFQDYVKHLGLTPEKLLPPAALKPPATLLDILLEPELLTPEKLNGWVVEGDHIMSGTGDAGPTVSIPLHMPKSGLYRLWIQYIAGVPNGRATTFVGIYRAGDEQAGPINQPDEIYDMPSAAPGPVWHDTLVDLPAGDYIIKIGHILRMWQGPGAYDYRRVSCLYLTDALWANAPTDGALKTIRDSAKPEGIQWTVTPALTASEIPQWTWWQLRPLSWEDAQANPKLFELSRSFWRAEIDALAQKEYKEDAPPDYRTPERQVVFDDTWNMLANPVRLHRQIETLKADVTSAPLAYHYVWHDVGANIDGLRYDGKYADTPYVNYGAWAGKAGDLAAAYGDTSGTVVTYIPVATPGKYTMWVLSSPVNLSYKAPWFGKVSADGREQFTYHHDGKIPTVWMKMGEVTVEKPGNVQVELALNGAGAGDTYRHIAAIFMTDDPNIIPSGTTRPPWTMDMFKARAAKAGAQPDDKLLSWITEDAYHPLSQEVWADKGTVGDAWPYTPVSGYVRTRDLLMARDTNRAVQVGLHNLTAKPLPVTVQVGPLQGKGGSFANAVNWRAEVFVPYGKEREKWAPFLLFCRENLTVPPLNVAGLWLTVDTHDIPAGNYTAEVKLTSGTDPAQTIKLNVKVSPVKPEPMQPVLVSGYTSPHEGNAYLQNFIDHGLNIWHGEMSKADMQKWDIRLIVAQQWDIPSIPKRLARLKELGLDYSDYILGIADEPNGGTEETLKPYIDIAKAVRAADPKVRIFFNPAEAAGLETFQLLDPYCDIWEPYVLHVMGNYFNNPEKRKIYTAKPWLWYSTPCYNDKTAREPGVRLVPSQPGNCIGVAYFAMNYPFRDEWDTAYEFVSDTSVMGALASRHGPVATIVWEQIREATQTANLAMMVRERLGVKTFDEVTDIAMQKLIRDGTQEELIRWLESHPKA